MRLSPVVGWKGGKRRLLPRLRPWFPVDDQPLAEPFVGMGALLLDMRARGWRGGALLADTNPEVRDFWRLAHSVSEGPALLRAAQALYGRFADGPGEADWWAMIEETPVDTPDRVARFLWLVNYAHANQSVRWTGERWHRTRGTGTKLKSAAKWGKTFPWSACVKRLEKVLEACGGCPVMVWPDAADVERGEGRTYADPPYLGTADYGRGGDEGADWAATVLGWEGHVVLSERRSLALPPGWVSEEGSVVARASAKSGATGRRSEHLYLSPVAARSGR